MTDAEKLRGFADYVLAFGENAVILNMTFALRRIADLLDAVPPETLAALKAGTWKAVPVEPTEEMVASGFDIHPCGPGQTKVTDCYCAMLAAAPKKLEG